ncbi:MAG: hypothetical protein ABIM60_02375 [candidate division WOR-3 bacterium]
MTQQKLITLFKERPLNILLYQKEDSTYIVEGIYKDRKEVIEFSPSEFKKIMEKEIERITVLEDQKAGYIIGQTLLGICIYSWSLPVFIFDEWDKTATGIAFLTPLFSFGTSFYISSKTRINNAAAYAGFMGGLTGAIYGFSLLQSEKAVFPFSIGFNLLDFYLCNNYGLTPGIYQRKLNHSLYGYYHYFSLMGLFNLYEKISFEDHLIGATLLSISESYLSLYFSKGDEYLTFGDALFELRTSLIGAEFLPALILTWANFRGVDISLEVWSISSLIGHSIGYHLGKELSKKNDLDFGPAFLTYLIPYLSHGFTAGLGILIGDEDYFKLYPLIFITSEIALTSFTYKFFIKKLESTSFKFDNLQFYFNPIPFLSNLRHNFPFFAFKINL